MPRPTVRIHDLETNEIIDREMNDQEFAQYEADVAKAKADEEARIAAENKRAEILARLGLTDEEAKLILS